MSLLLDVATRATLRWTRVYTAGLPAELAQARRRELESDIWEHQAFDRAAGENPADTGFEILMRMLLGVPADLLWRRSVSVQTRRAAAPITKLKGEPGVVTKLLAPVATVFTVLVGLFLLYNGVGIGFFEHFDFFSASEIVAGLCLIAGVLLVSRSPRAGTTLVIVGALGAALIHYWMLAIGLPIAVVIIVGSLARTGTFRRGDTTPA